MQPRNIARLLGGWSWVDDLHVVRKESAGAGKERVEKFNLKSRSHITLENGGRFILIIHRQQRLQVTLIVLMKERFGRRPIFLPRSWRACRHVHRVLRTREEKNVNNLTS